MVSVLIVQIQGHFIENIMNQVLKYICIYTYKLMIGIIHKMNVKIEIIEQSDKQRKLIYLLTN